MEEITATLYLWQQRTLYLGQVGRLTPVTQGAHALILGLDGELPLRVGKQCYCARSYLVPAGVTYSLDSRKKPIACCFLDPLGKDLLFHRPLMSRQPCGIFISSSKEQQQRTLLADLLAQHADAETAYQRLSDVLFPAPETNVAGFQADARIAQVVDTIRADPAENISNDRLAASLGLSGDRLQRLFKKVTGVPIRRYRLWHRLFVTSSMMAMGSSLTAAAQAAGFADSSHLTHVFRKMLGLSPSAVLRRSQHIRLLIGRH